MSSCLVSSSRTWFPCREVKITTDMLRRFTAVLPPFCMALTAYEQYLTRYNFELTPHRGDIWPCLLCC